MADILIKNIVPPKGNESVYLTISKEGVFEWDENKLDYVKVYDWVELPHGDLLARGNVLFNLQVEALGIDPKDKDFKGIKKGILLARKAIAECAVVLEASI